MDKSKLEAVIRDLESLVTSISSEGDVSEINVFLKNELQEAIAALSELSKEEGAGPKKHITIELRTFDPVDGSRVHGFVKESFGGGWVLLERYMDDEYVVCVEDDGKGGWKQKEGTGIYKQRPKR